MNHKPIAVFVPTPPEHEEWERRFTLNWIDSEPAVITHLYSEDLVRQQQAEIEALKSRELTLTNEEILEYADAYGLGIGNIYEFGHGQFIAVIRAILRKAQEK